VQNGKKAYSAMQLEQQIGTYAQEKSEFRQRFLEVDERLAEVLHELDVENGLKVEIKLSQASGVLPAIPSLKSILECLGLYCASIQNTWCNRSGLGSCSLLHSESVCAKPEALD
jgi:hypothetical protein